MQGRIQTKTNRGLQVDHPVIGGSGGTHPRNLKNEAFSENSGGVTDTKKTPGYGPGMKSANSLRTQSGICPRPGY